MKESTFYFYLLKYTFFGMTFNFHESRIFSQYFYILKSRIFGMYFYFLESSKVIYFWHNITYPFINPLSERSEDND